MFFTNPTEDNFQKYLESTSTRSIIEYSSGSQGTTDSSNFADLANAKFERKNYFIYSIFNITSPTSISDVIYIGVFKAYIKIS